MPRLVTSLLFCLVVFAAVPARADHAATHACAAQPFGAGDVSRLVAWIEQLQYDTPLLPADGAIRLHHDPAHVAGGVTYFRVGPYNTNLALVGVLGANVEHDRKIAIARAWIDWYLRHAEADGTILDHWYRADGSGETTAPPCAADPVTGALTCVPADFADSEDSYAATFLDVLWLYAQQGGSLDVLTGRVETVRRIANVMTRLQQADGLTWAKATYRVKYLMDNSEVYRGLRSAALLFAHVFGDSAQARAYDAAAVRVQQGIASLYDGAAKRYVIARMEDGSVVPARLATWTYDQVAQVWPYLFGVTWGSSGAAPAVALNRRWDGSPSPDWTRVFPDPARFTWPSVGLAVARAGHPARARRHAELVHGCRFPLSADAPLWPFSVDDAGWLLRTLTRLGIGG